ncbi:MAG: helix-turn-helix domain-containing protein, partial [Myxococcota bacterium]
NTEELSKASVQAHNKAQTVAHRNSSSSPLSATITITLEMMRQGLDVEQIARQRQVKTTTIVNHVVKAAEKGEADIDFSAYLDGALLPVIRTVAESSAWRTGLKSFRDEVLKLYPGSRVAYDTLKMNIAYLIQEGSME